MTVNDALSGIESKASWLRHYVSALDAFVDRLVARRSFFTRAEDGLDQLERDLSGLLEKVRKARAEIAAKPVNDKAA